MALFVDIAIVGHRFSRRENAFIARLVLRIFFPERGESMKDGILIESPEGPYLVKAIFASFLADLLGHKELTAWKGTCGTICCLDCANLRLHAKGESRDDTIGLDCFDRSKFDHRSTADNHAIVDDLVYQEGTLGGDGSQQIADFGWHQLHPKWHSV